MFCKQCGVKNAVGSKFCEACGAKMIVPRQKQPTRKPEASRHGGPAGSSRKFRKNESLKNKRRKPLIILLGVLSLASLLLVGWVFMNHQTSRIFNDAMDEGNRYLLEENLEQAEAYFLRAIEINPREVEPYLQLADIYMSWGEPERAIDILEQGKEAVSEEDRLTLEGVLDEIRENEGVSPPANEEDEGDDPDEPRFRWVLEPSIEADDINYIKCRSEVVENVNLRHFSSQYAVIQRGETFGLIDYRGNIKGDMFFAGISTFAGKNILNLGEQRVYEEYYPYPLRTDVYALVDGRPAPYPSWVVFDGLDIVRFYYFEGLHYIHTACYGIRPDAVVPSGPMPVRNTGIMYSQGDWTGHPTQWYGDQTGLLGVHYQGQMRTDFVYTQMGSYSEGLLAVERDGRWGYIDKVGEIIIPIEFDSSWKYSAWHRDELVEIESAFAASEGFIPLVRDGVWEMRDTNGEVVIPPGIFEAIRPVYQRRSWVKQDGFWGVIEMITDITDEEEVRTDDDHLVWHYVENIIFSRHGGGWGITITMKENGRFSGNYTGGHIISHREDIDNEVSISNFEGRFSIVEQIDANTFSLEIVEFTVLTPTGTEEIVDRTHFTYVEPVGLRPDDKFMLFQPGSSISNLPESFVGWFAIQGETLSFWGLHNMDLDMGFIGE